MNKKIVLFIFLYLSKIIISAPSISAILSIEEISTQKCFSAKNAQSEAKTKIYQITNNSTSNTVFIQYMSLSEIIISDSIKEDASVIFKDSQNLGSYYLNMKEINSNYYITTTEKTNDYIICFESFPNTGKEFKQNSNNTNIKLASYQVITSTNLSYFIDNHNFAENKIFYTIRFAQNILEKINMPKIQMIAHFINSQRKEELINIDNWYLQNNYYYAPFYVPKLNYTEKFTKIIFCISLELKQPLAKDEILKFDLELIDSQEITCECNINILPNNAITPKVFYINIQKNIYEFDRDILLLKQDLENKYINPFLSPNLNIDNKNVIFIKKDLIDINKYR